MITSLFTDIAALVAVGVNPSACVASRLDHAEAQQEQAEVCQQSHDDGEIVHCGSPSMESPDRLVDGGLLSARTCPLTRFADQAARRGRATAHRAQGLAWRGGLRTRRGEKIEVATAIRPPGRLSLADAGRGGCFRPHWQAMRRVSRP
jgi:hypothetical protein